jgi:hypothetical protein
VGNADPTRAVVGIGCNQACDCRAMHGRAGGRIKPLAIDHQFAAGIVAVAQIDVALVDAVIINADLDACTAELRPDAVGITLEDLAEMLLAGEQRVVGRGDDAGHQRLRKHSDSRRSHNDVTSKSCRHVSGTRCILVICSIFVVFSARYAPQSAGRPCLLRLIRRW